MTVGGVPVYQGRGASVADYDEEEEADDEGGVLQASMEEEMAQEQQPGYGQAVDYSGCTCGGSGQCNACRGSGGGPAHGFWGRAEYLYWFVQGQSVPVLATTSPVGTPQATAGVLPGATTLFGGDQINGQGRSGGRFTLGYWFDPCETVGIETTSLFLQQGHTTYNSGGSTGTPILARPFTDASTGLNNANLIAFPGLVSGAITAASTTKMLGTEVDFRRMVNVYRNRRTDILLGYRFIRFDEGLEVATTSTSTATGGVVPVGTNFLIHDTFGTQNMFNGGNIGLRTEWFHNDRWSFDVLAKAALGVMQQNVSIAGATTTTVPGFAPSTAAGGILALPRTLTSVGPGGNIGNYTRNRFSAIPELDVNLHYQITPIWRLNVGYSLLYLTNVVRPGNQIDTTVDPNRFPPPATPVSQHPVFTFNETSVWMQGINLGLEARF